MSSHCVSCDRAFKSRQALLQHERDSPAHSSFGCEICNRSFGSEEALEQHIRDSPRHQRNSDTSLDVFFHSFSTFDYDPSLPPATSYANLQRHQQWRPGDAASHDAWNRYQDALEGELHQWYGAENDITAWHALCRAIGTKPLPQTCAECEKAVRETHVNIVDLIEWGRRRHDNEEPVRTFPDVAGLRAYSKRTRKIFVNTLERGDSNVVLRHLLRRIFREG